MSKARGLIYYTMGSVLFLAIFCGNLLVWRSPLLGLALLLVTLPLYGSMLGQRLTSAEDRLGQLVLGICALLAAFSLLGAAAYYLDALNQTLAAATIILLPLIVFFFHRPSSLTALPFPRWTWANALTLATTAILTAAAIAVLLTHPIAMPARSPWLVIPGIFFLTVFLIALSAAAEPRRWLVITLFFLTIAVALLAYPLGYGFDGFIHRATERHIFETGSINPKPLYYAGQYGLVLILAHGFALPSDLVDTILVPLLATLFLPLSAYLGFKKLLGQSGRPAAAASLSLFLMPFASFVTTTPQALANIWTLLALFVEGRLAILFALAALATHPLAGIPIFIYLIVRFLTRRQEGQRLLLPFSILASLSLPLIFIVNAALAHLPISLSLQNLGSTSWTELLGLTPFLQNRFHPLLDAAYLFGWNRILILIALVIPGLILLRRLNPRFPITLFLLPSLILLVNYLLLSTVVHFDFLIDYERQNYALRVFETAQFFLLPIIGLTIAKLYEIILTKPMAIRAGWTVLVAIILTASLYLTYPRHDNYEVSRGFNVGVSDYDTVKFIHDQNTTVNYVVLANQAVSAAAMDRYGFLHYFHTNIFYYPIPTGGPLYQIYLDMVSAGPTRTKALTAMDLAGVDKAYVVINDYWFLASKLIEDAKREASTWTAIDGGATYVFEYVR